MGRTRATTRTRKASLDPDRDHPRSRAAGLDELLHAFGLVDNPHPGNYGFGDDGRIVVYDFGRVRQFDVGFFGILTKQSLTLTNFPSKKALRDHIEAYVTGWNSNPTPFIWTKPAAAIIRSHRRMIDRISGAVHLVGSVAVGRCAGVARGRLAHGAGSASAARSPPRLEHPARADPSCLCEHAMGPMKTHFSSLSLGPRG